MRIKNGEFKISQASCLSQKYRYRFRKGRIGLTETIEKTRSHVPISHLLHSKSCAAREMLDTLRMMKRSRSHAQVIGTIFEA